MDDFTNKYPYTDFHEMNLDWFLDHFDDVMKMIMQNNETVKGLIEYIHSLGLVVIDDNAPAPDKVYSSQKTQNLLNGKVDKVAGYGLSQNDFTNALKNKLDGIEAGANYIHVADSMSAYQTDPVEGGVIYQALNAKVDKEAGKQLSQENFTSTLKTKLDGIEAGATRVLVDNHLDPDSVNPVQNMLLSYIFSDIADRLVNITDDIDDINDELDEKQDKNEAILQAENAYTLLCENPIPDSDPYINRQIPVPFGKFEKLKKIIGASIVWNQLVQNGNFADTSNWTERQSGSMSVESGRLKVTAQVNGNNNQIYQGVTIATNHIYFVSAKIQNGSGALGVRFGLYSGTSSVTDATKLISTTATETQYQFLLKATGEGTNFRFGQVNATEGDIMYFDDIYMTDITAEFNPTIADYAYTLESGTEGAGVAWLKSYDFFTKDYYTYATNKIESVSLSGHKIVGKNLFDKTNTDTTEGYTSGKWIDGSGNTFNYSTYSISVYIKIIGGENYTLSNITSQAQAASGRGGYCFYDTDKNVVSGGGVYRQTEITVTAPETARYIRISIFDSTKDDTQIEQGSTATAYSPYIEETTALDHTTLRGLFKLDTNNNLYADGDIYNADGSESVKYAEVDMGSLSWSYGNPTGSSQGNQFYSDSLSSTIKPFDNQANKIPNLLCDGLSTSTINDIYGGAKDNVISGYASQSKRLIVRCTAYTDAQTFKTAMSGKKLVYELATPTTATLTPFNELSALENGGTEEFIDYGVQQGTRDVSVPAGTDTDFLQGTGLPDLPTTAGTYNLQYNPATGFAWG